MTIADWRQCLLCLKSLGCQAKRIAAWAVFVAAQTGQYCGHSLPLCCWELVEVKRLKDIVFEANGLSMVVSSAWQNWIRSLYTNLAIMQIWEHQTSNIWIDVVFFFFSPLYFSIKASYFHLFSIFKTEHLVMARSARPPPSTRRGPELGSWAAATSGAGGLAELLPIGRFFWA